ncbi:IS701 family transposase [Aeoliella sp. ICT_H6.2]|uniref:IS701 family transposase n=1 Tax=Aeoliella straminimaris TaxID=2954799 RepID=A0A9X2F542_9BACT|nr:IS701 family transposase [Aeoliella straminimaris]MCO6042422.1 IS701 family transposase [Aeoliella straminimaris]
MERRFEVRRDELLAECEVAPAVFRDVIERLERFMEPFTCHLVRSEQVEHASTYVHGLLSDVKRKNVESIAYRHDQVRIGLQRFIGFANWDDAPLREELARQVGEHLGEADGVIVFDPSSFPKKGNASVGVQRQWSGRLGKIDNCQIGVYMGYASSQEHALVDMRLYLPKDWAKDKARRQKAGVPKEIRYRSRHALCLQMLAEKGTLLPHQWIAGDDEMGRPYHFRRDLQELGESYLLAIPSNTLIRDLDTGPPTYSGKGHPPKRPWQQVQTWREVLLDSDWTQIEVRAGKKVR